MKTFFAFARSASASVLVAWLFFSQPAAAQGAVGVVAAGAAMNGIVDNLRGSILAILSRLDQKVLPLPDAVQSYVVSARLFNGKTRDYNAPGRDEFFALERDDANRSLKLSPRPLADAFK